MKTPLLLLTSFAIISNSASAALYTYEFSGTVSSASGGAHPSISNGSIVSGTFTIDYCTTDSDPSAQYGTYTSNGMTLDIDIGGVSFDSSSSIMSVLYIEADPSVNEITFDALPLSTGQPDYMAFSFFSPTDTILSSDNLPSSRDVFNAFPSVVLYAETNGRTEFGEYELDINVYSGVPEPSSTILSILALSAPLLLRRRP